MTEATYKKRKTSLEQTTTQQTKKTKYQPNGIIEMPMPSITPSVRSMSPTISNIVILPNEYKDRMSAGHFNPGFQILQDSDDSQKPLIYVTHPDDVVDEIWVPPVTENIIHRGDDDSDDETCSCSGTLDIPYTEPLSEKAAMMDICNIVEDTSSNEMYFYRTGWQNRVVHATGDRSSKMVYYVDIPWKAWGTSLTIHRGHKGGHVVAQVARHGPGRPFEITFSDPKQRQCTDNGKLVLKFGCIYSRTHKFVYRGRNLAWKHGFSARRLKDLDTDEVIAEFHSRRATSLHKDGKLVFLGDYARDEAWVDVIVATALSCQQREREIRRTAARGSGGGDGS
jgi:hypothetical protein